MVKTFGFGAEHPVRSVCSLDGSRAIRVGVGVCFRLSAVAVHLSIIAAWAASLLSRFQEVDHGHCCDGCTGALPLAITSFGGLKASADNLRAPNCKP